MDPAGVASTNLGALRQKQCLSAVQGNYGVLIKLLIKARIGRQYSALGTCVFPEEFGHSKGRRKPDGGFFVTRNQVPGNRLRVRIPCPPL